MSNMNPTSHLKPETLNLKRPYSFLIGLTALALALGCGGCTAGQGMSRGSDKVLRSVVDELKFTNEDLGKSVQLRLTQKLLISLAPDPVISGKWSIEHVDRQKFFFLSNFVRGESGFNQIWYYEARAYGSFTFTLVYTPFDTEAHPKKEFKVPVFISNIQ